MGVAHPLLRPEDEQREPRAEIDRSDAASAPGRNKTNERTQEKNNDNATQASDGSHGRRIQGRYPRGGRQRGGPSESHRRPRRREARGTSCAGRRVVEADEG